MSEHSLGGASKPYCYSLGFSKPYISFIWFTKATTTSQGLPDKFGLFFHYWEDYINNSKL